MFPDAQEVARSAMLKAEGVGVAVYEEDNLLGCGLCRKFLARGRMEGRVPQADDQCCRATSPRMSVVAKDGCPRPTQPSRSVPTCSVTFASSPLRNARGSPLPVERKEQNYGKSTQTQHRLCPRPLGRRLLLQQTHPDPSGRGT